MDVIYRLIGGHMIQTGIIIILLIACGIFYKVLDKVSKDMLLLNQRVQNVEAEIYMPVVKTEMPDKTIQTRITLCGALKMIMDKVNSKPIQTKPRIIIPGVRQ